MAHGHGPKFYTRFSKNHRRAGRANEAGCRSSFGECERCVLEGQLLRRQVHANLGRSVTARCRDSEELLGAVMKTLLVVEVSPRREFSVSRNLTARFVEQWKR